MVRLTAELIEDSYQYINPVKEYELNLRGEFLPTGFSSSLYPSLRCVSFSGNKISILENLGATLNQFDTIDFTDNDVRRLDGELGFS